MRPLAFLILSCLISGCTRGVHSATHPKLIPGAADAPSQVTPAEALAIARKYSTHKWFGSTRNVMHGLDPDGISVQTPDITLMPESSRKGWWIPGTINTGIPYKWGGYDDPSTFNAAIAAGLAAGDVSTPAKRHADNSAISRYTAGIDCSGLVSKCFKLPRPYDTRELPKICDPLPHASELCPGDILNIPRGHVILFAGWKNPEHTEIEFFEIGCGAQMWKPGLKSAPLAKMLAIGYKPLRYKGMARALPSTTPSTQSEPSVSRAPAPPMATADAS